MTSLRVGTRGSKLALWQANAFLDLWRSTHPDWPADIVTVQSQGDQDQTTPLTQFGTGAFTSALETALQNQVVDVAVHSFKDLPTQLAAGLRVAACLPRGSVDDVMFTAQTHAPLDAASTLLTSSPRRQALLRIWNRAPVATEPLRGNVATRMEKWLARSRDVLILARAGLDRLRLSMRRGEVLRASDGWLPAPAQGVIAIEIREQDTELAQRLSQLNAEPAMAAATMERELLSNLGGGCALPLGAHAFIEKDRWRLRAILAHPTEHRQVAVDVRHADPHSLVHEAVHRMQDLDAQLIHDLASA